MEGGLLDLHVRRGSGLVKLWSTTPFVVPPKADCAGSLPNRTSTQQKTQRTNWLCCNLLSGEVTGSRISLRDSGMTNKIKVSRRTCAICGQMAENSW